MAYHMYTFQTHVKKNLAHYLKICGSKSNQFGILIKIISSPNTVKLNTKRLIIIVYLCKKNFARSQKFAKIKATTSPFWEIKIAIKPKTINFYKNDGKWKYRLFVCKMWVQAEELYLFSKNRRLKSIYRNIILKNVIFLCFRTFWTHWHQKLKNNFSSGKHSFLYEIEKFEKHDLHTP